MKKWLWIPIGIIICVVLIGIINFVIGKVQSYQLELNGELQADILESLKDKLNEHAVGGLTQEEIDKQTSDDDTPRTDDQIIEMYIREYADGVVIYYAYHSDDGNVLYPNLYFRKLDGALSVDGIMNANLNCAKKNAFAKYQWDNAYVYYNFEKMPTYTFDDSDWPKQVSNLASISDKKVYYWENYRNSRAFVSPSEKEVRLAGDLVTSAIGEVYGQYFGTIGALSMIDTPNGTPEVFKVLNTYFTYLYNSCKSDNHEAQTKIVDVSNLMVCYIPEEEKENYPISEDKQNEYGEKQYYDLYVCNKYVECHYTYDKTKIKQSTLSDEYKESHEYNKLDPSPVEQSSIEIRLINGNSADISTIDFETNSIKITVTGGITNKVITFDERNEVLYGKTIVLPNNATYNYTIDSQFLMFDSLSGSFEVTNTINVMQLTYQYVPNSVVLTVGLNLVGSVDYSQLDLSAHPVVITLNNDNHSYTYTFDDNNSVSAYKSQIVALGTYNYTILSDQLVFTSTSGTIDVTTSNRLMVFNCGFVGVSRGFDISINSDTVQSGQVPVGEFTLYFDESIFSDIVTSNYNVSVYIYNNEGMILDHDFVNKKLSSLISGQTTNTGHISTKDHFVIDNTYTVQVAVIDTVNNIYYYSTPEEFVFMGTCEITIDNFNIGGIN